MQGGQVFEHIGGGGPLAGLGFLAALEAHLFEQDRADLPRGLHVEFVTGEFVKLGLEPGHFLRKGVGHARERVAVDLDAVHLHLREDRDHRAFHGLVDGGDAGAVQLGFEGQPEAQGDIRILGCIGGGILDRDLVKSDRGFSGAEQRFDRDRRVVEIAFGEDIHAVVMFAGMERVGHQHGVVDRRDVDAVAGKDLGVVFHVLADLEDRGILEHRFQQVERLLQGDLAVEQAVGAEEIISLAILVGQRDVAGMAGVDAERDAHQIGGHFIETGGFRIDGDIAAFADAFDPGFQRGGVGDAVMLGLVEGGHFRCVLTGLFGGRFWDGRGLDIELVGDTFGERAEFHAGQELHQLFRVRVAHFEIVEGEGKRGLAIELDELFRQFDLFAHVDEGLAALGLLDFFGAVEKGFEIAEFVDQERGGLDADPGRAGHVIDRIPGERLHIHHAVGEDTEFLKDAVAVDALVLHRVEHFDAVAD